MWQEEIEKLEKLWKNNPRSYPSPSNIDIAIFRELIQKGVVYHEAKSIEDER